MAGARKKHRRSRATVVTGCSSNLAITLCTIDHCTSANTCPPIRRITTNEMAHDSGAITSASNHPWTCPQHSTPATTNTIPGRCSSSASPKPRIYSAMPKNPALSIALCTLTGSMSGNPFLATSVPIPATATSASSPNKTCTFRDRDSFELPPGFPDDPSFLSPSKCGLAERCSMVTRTAATDFPDSMNAPRPRFAGAVEEGRGVKGGRGVDGAG
mmetsp:Transcript_13374/g.32515  ORF Transcript_13374/g.32515 Transcript_13374/m.32515 type:complete len:215 (+) Transcript_13374:450-1094(+)